MLDIGNTHAHIYSDDKVKHISIPDAIERYRDETVYYISVNEKYYESLLRLTNWINISKYISISGEYPTMGTDRKALCSSRDSGVFVDAGSAITVDKVENGSYLGGFILPGIYAYKQAYSDIAPVLSVEIDRAIDIDKLPCDTVSGVGYGAISSIVASIDRVCEGMPLYFTGGDGEWLSRYFEKAVFSDILLFEGMKKVITQIPKQNKGKQC